MRKQNTIKENIEFSGIGLHSGNSCRVILKPAPEDTGLVFAYKNSNQSPLFIPYSPEHVVDTQNNISVSNGKAIVKTVEHLVSALYGLRIDNCIIECNSSEIPIMDGSGSEFVKGLLSIGIIPQSKDKFEFKVVKPIWVTLNDKFLVALPYNGLKLSYTISFPNSPIGTQTYNFDFNQKNYIEELSNARTFGFIEDLDHYRKNGLALGGGFENVHVFSKEQNTHLNTPRYNDEPVRHKLLDLLGCLAILNFDISGFIISYKGGHHMDVLFAKKFLTYLEGENGKTNSDYQTTDKNYYFQLAQIVNPDNIPS